MSDPFWQHFTRLKTEEGYKLQCNHCPKQFTRGIYRGKIHLAKLSRRGVDPCPGSSPELARDATQALDSVVLKKAKKQAIDQELRMRVDVSSSVGSGCAATPSSSRSRGIHSYFEPRTTLGAQPSITSLLNKKDKHEVDMLVAKFVYYEGLPLNVAHSPYWQPMFDVVCSIGSGYKAPSYEDLSGHLVRDLKEECTIRVAEIKDSWKITGCTIMSDGWTDRKNRSLLNFLVYCPRGTIFLKSVDASEHVKDATMLCDLLHQFVLEVGVENVVQVVTGNAPSYVAAGRLLMERLPTIFWTPCAVHVIDLILEDIGKIDWVKEVIDQARLITKFIYNKARVLSMMRRYTKGKELLRQGVTRFASYFISLQSIQKSMPELRAMFCSREWFATPISTKPDAREVASLIVKQSFWDAISEICSVTEPLIVVLRLVDGDRPTMGYLYEAMDRAKEHIKIWYEEHPDQDNEFGGKFDLFWGIIDGRWNNMLHKPIHVAGALLNPSLLFAPSSTYMADGEVSRGLIQTICTMVDDSDKRNQILMDLEMYKNSQGFFGFHAARDARMKLSPDLWWKYFGSDTPLLQNLAIRILSQTCSISACELNWSAFEKIHSKKRNRLLAQRLNDIVFIYVNMRLYVKELSKKNDKAAIDLSSIDPSYSDILACDPVNEDNVDEEFRASWIELDQELEAIAEEGEEMEPPVTVTLEDPFPDVDFGVEPSQLEDQPKPRRQSQRHTRLPPHATATSPIPGAGPRRQARGGRPKRARGR